MCLHNRLCSGQWAFWQLGQQYRTVLHGHDLVRTSLPQ